MDFIDKIVNKVNALLKQISMSTININGKIIETSSKNVTIKNGKVIINGKDVTPESKEITITVNGSLEKLEVDACNTVSVAGNVNTLKTMSGDVEVKGDVSGDVKTMSGDVKCGKIGGSVSTLSGDIKNEK